MSTWLELLCRFIGTLIQVPLNEKLSVYIYLPHISKLPGTGPQIVLVMGSPNGGGEEDHLGAAQAVNHSTDALGVLDHQVLL